MKKKVIRLTESELYRIITSSAKKYIKEAMEYQPSEEVEWDYESIDGWEDTISIDSSDGLYRATFNIDENGGFILDYISNLEDDTDVSDPEIVNSAKTIAKRYIEDYWNDLIESEKSETDSAFGSEGNYWGWKQGR